MRFFFCVDAEVEEHCWF